ncbi:MAG: acyltransferase family protein [Collinsella sp.]
MASIFFVLSGYLITRLLLNEVAKTGRIDLKSFWIRRIRRLVPAVVTVVFVTCALCTIFNHVMLTKMRPDILPSLLFFNNWWQIAQNVSYFNALGDPSPLTHFWSLAIEEQFYLIWPPLLFAMVSMHVSKPNTRRVVLGLAAVSALAMMVLYNPAADPSRVLRHRHPRVLAATGCLDGLYPRSRPGAGASRSSFGAQSPGWRRQARQESRGQA